jgi:hypothetical protein
LVVEGLLDVLEEVNAVALGKIGFSQADEGERRVVEEIVGEPRESEDGKGLTLD